MVDKPQKSEQNRKANTDEETEDEFSFLTLELGPPQSRKARCSSKQLQLLIQLKEWRERLSKPSKTLECYVKFCIQESLKAEKYALAVVYKFEKLSVPNPNRTPEMTIRSGTKILEFSKKHDVNVSIFEVAIASNRMFAYMYQRDMEKCTESMQKLLEILRSEGGGYERNLMFYNLGSFFMMLLRQSIETNVQDIIRTLGSFGRGVSKTKDGKVTLKNCLQVIREAAADCFYSAREALVAERQKSRNGETNRYQIISYFYDSPMEVIFPLIMIANANLDVPEWTNGQKRCLVTDDDLSYANSCLDQAKIEYDKSGVKSPRFVGRYHINMAGYYFRRSQIQVKELKKATSSTTLEAGVEGVDTRVAEINESLKNALNNAKEAIDINSSFKETGFASKFREFLTKYQVKTEQKIEEYVAVRFMFANLDLHEFSL